MKLRTELAESKVAGLSEVDLLIMRKLSKINSFSNVKCQQKLATLIKANYTIESKKKGIHHRALSSDTQRKRQSSLVWSTP